MWPKLIPPLWYSDRNRTKEPPWRRRRQASFPSASSFFIQIREKSAKTQVSWLFSLCHCMTLESYRTAGSHRPGLMQYFIDLWGEFCFPAGCSEERGAAGRLRRRWPRRKSVDPLHPTGGMACCLAPIYLLNLFSQTEKL